MPAARPRASTTPPLRRRGRLWARLVAGFVASVLLGAGAAAGLVHWGLAKIDRSVVTGLVGAAEAAETAAKDTGPRLLNVLIVGNDSREGLSPQERRAFGTGHHPGTRTDTIMLVQLELDGRGRGAVLSFPRDLLVTRCDGSEGRINAAYGIGLERNGDGPSCLVETVADLTGVEINHYVEISFAGFLKVVDAIGGVGLYLDEPLVDAKAHIDLPAGCVQLRGGDALGFVRARHIDNDFGRIARQQRFLKETVREATDLGVLANPARLYQLIEAGASAVKTDDGLDLAGMRRIAEGMRRLTAGGLQVHTVPAESRVVGGTWYVLEKPKEAERLYQSFRDGTALRAPARAAESEVPRLPSVTVLNATGKPGIAAVAGEVLAAEGYGLTEVGNDDDTGLERTRILHPPELAEAAEGLAELFPGAQVVQGVSGLSLTVKLGGDVDIAELQSRLPDPDTADKADLTGREQRATPTEKPQAQTSEPAYRGAQMTDVDC